MKLKNLLLIAAVMGFTGSVLADPPLPATQNVNVTAVVDSNCGFVAAGKQDIIFTSFTDPTQMQNAPGAIEFTCNTGTAGAKILATDPGPNAWLMHNGSNTLGYTLYYGSSAFVAGTDCHDQGGVEWHRDGTTSEQFPGTVQYNKMVYLCANTAPTVVPSGTYADVITFTISTY